MIMAKEWLKEHGILEDDADFDAGMGVFWLHDVRVGLWDDTAQSLQIDAAKVSSLSLSFDGPEFRDGLAARLRGL